MEGLTHEQEDIVRTVESLLENLRNELIEAINQSGFHKVWIEQTLANLSVVKSCFDLSKPQKGE